MKSRAMEGAGEQAGDSHEMVLRNREHVLSLSFCVRPMQRQNDSFPPFRNPMQLLVGVLDGLGWWGYQLNRHYVCSAFNNAALVSSAWPRSIFTSVSAV